MSAVTPPNRARRARIYFRLMDLTLIFALIGFVDYLLGVLWDRTLLPEGSLAYEIVGVVVIIMNLGAPLLLVVARFMRDEYAELLWRRSAAVFTNAIATLPIALLAGAWVAYLVTRTGSAKGVFGFLYLEYMVFDVMMVGWFAFMLLFVAIFQFLRWRDSR